MPPRGRIDRLVIFYDYASKMFFCEATDIRGVDRYLERKVWIIPMNMDREGNVSNFSKGALADFILDCMKDSQIPFDYLSRFLNENFHGSIESVKFEKIS